MDYKLIDYGIENCQYLIPNGTVFTSFENSYLGAGDTFQEALEDALEQIAASFSSSKNVAELEKQVKADYAEALKKESPSANIESIKAIMDEDNCSEEDAEETLSNTGSDLYYYVELLV